MRKLTLSTQLILLSIIIFLTSAIVFSVTSIQVISRIIEDETCKTLSSYAILVDKDSDSNINKFKIDISYVIKDGNDYYEYPDKTKVDKSLIDAIITDVKAKKAEYPNGSNIFIARNKYKNNDTTYYYAYKTEDNMQNYTIVYTSAATINPLFMSLAFRINLIFFIVMVVIIIVLYFWINSITKRLKNIQKYVLDLTDENKDMKINDKGDDEVADLSRSVEHMKEEILYNEHTKQEMLQNLSHDFKTPIAVIRNYAEALEDGVEDFDVATKKIIEQADILKKKVNRLLQYNSIEYLTKDREFEDVYMNEIITNVLTNYKHQLEGIKLDICMNEDVYFKGYSENWYVVVENLVDNAKRYAKSEIKILLKKGKLFFYNDGEPLEEKFVQNLFKPYEKGSKGQFGLGMSIVQKTVAFFNMNLTARNETIGVTFTIEENEL